MNDSREMLAQAAKAAGAVWAKNLNTWLIWKGPEDPDEGGAWCEWAPLTDDGDCARMEADISISIQWEEKCIEVFHEDTGYLTEAFIDHGGDRQAARRLASLRVAAEIGKTLP